MADKIVAEYTVKVDKALKDLEKLAGKVDKVDKKRKKTQAGFEKMTKKLENEFKRMGAQLIAAFAIDRMARFAAEAVKLAGQVEGVRRAFEKLDNPNLLNDLRKATRGTVDDLKLMQSAVRAKNFKIPLDQLAGYFKFATNRAIETGESVDYLVNSIIDGIGRKSTLVLDNLGISATELQAEVKKVGDFGEAAGNIIARNLAEAGDVADTTAIKISQLNTQLDNAKVKFGEALIGSAAFWAETLGIIDGVDAKMQGINAAMATLKTDRLTDLKSGYRDLSDIFVEIETQLEKVRATQAKIDEEAKTGSGPKLAALGEQLKLDQARLDTLREVFEIEKKRNEDGGGVVTQETIKNLAYYNALIKELKEEQGDANTTRQRVRDLENEINEAIRQRLILLGKLRETGGDSMETIPTIGVSAVDAQTLETDEIIDDYGRRNKEIEDAIKERNAMEAALAEERRQKEAEIAFAVTNETLNSMSSLVSSISQIQSNAFAEEQYRLQQQLEQGLITREEFDEKTKQIRRKQAQADKDAATFQAIIGTSQAVMQALANVAPPASYGLAAVAAALGAVEIAAIATAPLPQFAKGVIDVQGKGTGTSDDIHAMISKGESVMTAEETRKHKGILEAMRNGNWDQYKMDNIIAPAIEQVLQGGFQNIGGAITVQNKFNDKNIIRAQDRNRQSQKEGWLYLGRKIDNLNRGGSRWN